LWYKTGIAYNQRYRWDGGAAGLDAVLGRQSLGLGSAATRAAADTVGNDEALPDGAAVINYINGRGFISNPNDSVDASELEVLFGPLGAGLMVRSASGVFLITPDNHKGWDTAYNNIIQYASNWQTAFTERRQWDGGATNLVPATGRNSLQLDTYYSGINHNHGTGTTGNLTRWNVGASGTIMDATLKESASSLVVGENLNLQSQYLHKLFIAEYPPAAGVYVRYIKFPANTVVYGVIKLRLSGGYNYKIATGNLEYSYLFGGSGGTIWRSERHCIRADGATPNYFAAGDMVWNATESCWAIPIYNRQSRNYFLIDFEYFSNVALTDNYEITLSGWEAWGTQPPISYPSYMTPLGIKVKDPVYDLDVNGSFRVTASSLSTQPSHIATQTGSDNVLRWQTWGDFINNLALSGEIGGGNLGGTGSAGYVAKFIASATLANSQIQDDGTNVAVGKTPDTSVKFDVAGNIRAQDDLAASTLSVGNVAKANVSSATITDASNQIPLDDLEYILSELWYRMGIAYDQRYRWDGGATGLNAATGRASLQLDSYYAAVGHNHGTGTAGYIAKWQTNELLERSVISESANLLNLATSAVLQGFNYYHKNVRTEWIQYDGAYRAYLKFPASTGLGGSLRLTITIPYIAYGTSVPGGTLIYEYGFMGNSSGTAYVNKRECKSTIGNTADYVVAGDIVWHTTDSCWAIPIYNLQKRNYPLVSIDYYSWYDLDSTFTITCSSWETYSMVPSRDYSWINDRLAVGKSGGAAFTLDVNGNAQVNELYFPDTYGDKLLLKSTFYGLNVDVNEFNLFSDRYFTMSSDTNTDAFIFDADTGSLTSKGNIIINGIYYGDGSGLNYVDADTLGGYSSNAFVKRAGDSMYGNLDMTTAKVIFDVSPDIKISFGNPYRIETRSNTLVFRTDNKFLFENGSGFPVLEMNHSEDEIIAYTNLNLSSKNINDVNKAKVNSIVFRTARTEATASKLLAALEDGEMVIWKPSGGPLALAVKYGTNDLRWQNLITAAGAEDWPEDVHALGIEYDGTVYRAQVHTGY